MPKTGMCYIVIQCLHGLNSKVLTRECKNSFENGKGRYGLKIILGVGDTLPMEDLANEDGLWLYRFCVYYRLELLTKYD